MGKEGVKRKLFSTDRVMKKLWFCLEHDAISNNGHAVSTRYRELLTADRMQEFRERQWPPLRQLDVYTAKWHIQLANLFKRYRFSSDVYTDDELGDMAIEKLMADQERLGVPPVVGQSLYLVLQEARKIVTKILGDYDLGEHVESCEFGMRSNRHVPLSKSHLCDKVGTLSGTKQQNIWFHKNVMEGDEILSSAHRKSAARRLKLKRVRKDTIYTQIRALRLAKVPKKWDALRTMMPDSVVGGFISNGLGRMMEKRLKKGADIDLSVQQVRHRKWARSASRTRKLVTADVRSASDSYVWWLLRRLLPSKWYNVVKLCGYRYLYLEDSTGQCHRCNLQSAMSMGLGHTFPLQTLLFYSLLTAVQNLTEQKGRISVFGDDLIYPRTIHRYVEKILPSLGFILNTEKTFVNSFFRESCGGDYLHGVDVRPFQPEGQTSELTRKRYEAFCYKLINGLRERWDECEINTALQMLYREVLRVNHEILAVPSSFPAHAGVLCGMKTTKAEIGIFPWAYPQWDVDLQCSKVKFLSQEPDYSYRVLEEDIYYWSKLRPTNYPVVELPWTLANIPSLQMERVRDALLPWGRLPELTQLRLIASQEKMRSEFTGRRYRVMVAMLPAKNKTNLKISWSASPTIPPAKPR